MMAEYRNIFYLPDFKVLDNGEFASICEEKDSPRACARFAKNLETKKESYYIKMHGGHVYNPFNETYQSKFDSKQVKYKKVSGEIFKKYVTYLKTGANYLIRDVERTVADD